MFRYVLLSLFLVCFSASAQWESALARMPLFGDSLELSRTECISRMLQSFRKNNQVKGILFMPGATDEFYFFRRAKVTLTNSSPSLLDALTALTNQNQILLRYEAPLVIVYTKEDPNPMLIEVKHESTAQKLKNRKFAKEVRYNDRDWDTLFKTIAFYFNTHLSPAARSHESNHFFRYHITAYDLSCFEMVNALCLAGKTKAAIERNKVSFLSDTRVSGRPSLEGIKTFED